LLKFGTWVLLVHYGSAQVGEWLKFTSDEVQDGGLHTKWKLGYLWHLLFLVAGIEVYN